ncbi:MAG: GGDEF domain-containing protein [Oscillospiraceae bacterium]|nr:GGDEF domain-containing protein [Oscillospiraceae bacterium]
MSSYRRPLNRSITIGCAIFIVLLCLILSIVTYSNYHRSMYERCEAQIADILNYVSGALDHDDLACCARTREKSEAYLRAQELLDSVYARFDIDDIYLIQAYREPDGRYNVMNIVTAFSPEEYAEGLHEIIDLGYLGDEIYGQEMLQTFYDIQEGGVLRYCEDDSTYGLDYTGVLPLRTRAGEVYGILCLDISMDAIHAVLRQYTMVNVALILILGAAFIVLFLLWMRVNVTSPIEKLENSVVSFARISHRQRNPELLVFHEPDIHTGNEVESLSKAVARMSEDMRSYVEHILETENKVERIRSRADEMDRLAHQDALTKVKNKAAYQEALDRLQALPPEKARYGILMVDLNNLKRINDTYGHEHGDEYIIRSSGLICRTCKRSPVFRIGGDEFVAVLEGPDYEDRETLRELLRRSFDAMASDESLEPWERCSAALGMAVFTPLDGGPEAVFKRADAEMYRNKKEMKACRR